MKILAPFLVMLLATSPLLASNAGTGARKISGNGALALAALVGENAPLLANEKAVLAAFLNGNPHVASHVSGKISVKADNVTCRASNVDLTMHSCELTFGMKKASLLGRAAHELYATLIEVGVPSDGAAGSIYEGVTKLVCTVDPKGVASADGSGAECSFTAGG